MVQQPCLPSQAERKVDAPPERRRPQCSYSCIQIEHHVVLTPEEILLNLRDAKEFFYRGGKMHIPERGPA